MAGVEETPEESKPKRAKFELSITLCRTSDNAVTEKVLQFSSPPNTVEDLKNAVETQYDIPRCLQTIEIGDRCIRSDDDRLSDHYVSTGDSIRVTYLYEAYVQHAREYTEQLRRLEQHLMSLDKELACSSLEWTFDRELNQGYHQFMTLSDTIIQRGLSSWFSDMAKANRMCLLQVGAIDVAVSLLRYLQVNFPWGEQPIEMQELVLSLLSFLWNLAVSTESQEPVISCGGFELMVAALKGADVENEKHHSLLAKAAGCVSNYCETPGCRIALAPDTTALQQLLKFALINTRDSFSRLIIANCFFRLSFSMETHRHLSSPAILGNMIKSIAMFMFRAGPADDNTLAAYAMLMAVGRILLLSSLTGVAVDTKDIKRTVTLMNHFLRLVDRTGMRQLQDTYSYNWNSLLPFIEPILSSECVSCRDILDLRKLFYFSLTLELPRDWIHQVVRNEDILEYLTCLQWYALDDNDTSSYKECFLLLSTIEQVEVPRLSTIVRAKLAVVSPLGYRNAQQPLKDIVHQLMKT